MIYLHIYIGCVYDKHKSFCSMIFFKQFYWAVIDMPCNSLIRSVQFSGLVGSQSCAAIITVNFGGFRHSPKKTCVHKQSLPIFSQTPRRRHPALLSVSGFFCSGQFMLMESCSIFVIWFFSLRIQFPGSVRVVACSGTSFLFVTNVLM